MSGPDRNMPYLTLLREKRYGGAAHLHAGLARGLIGIPFCDDGVRLGVDPLFSQDPNFALHRRAGWRHRYAEAALELNRGCQTCLGTLYEIGREIGYRPHGSLKELAR